MALTNNIQRHKQQMWETYKVRRKKNIDRWESSIATKQPLKLNDTSEDVLKKGATPPVIIQGVHSLAAGAKTVSPQTRGTGGLGQLFAVLYPFRVSQLGTEKIIGGLSSGK